MMQESRRHPPCTGGFQCSERVVKDGVLTSIIFRCNLPTKNTDETNEDNHLEFHCREPSCGVLEWGEASASLTDEDYAVDPNFFDGGYSMAGSTGFKIWTGTRLLIETLAWPRPEEDCMRLREIQRRICSGANLIELGAGVGVVGTYLAAIGAHALVTDLPTLVENAIRGNLLRNKNITESSSLKSDDENRCPLFLLPHGLRIGKGWAESTPLDWTCPLAEQLSNAQSRSIDFIVASDVVFLVSMLNSLLDTVESLFSASSSNNPSFILSFQRRDSEDGEASASFTTVNRVLLEVIKRGWSIECLAWRPVTVSKETKEGGVIKVFSEVFVFEIKP